VRLGRIVAGSQVDPDPLARRLDPGSKIQVLRVPGYTHTFPDQTLRVRVQVLIRPNQGTRKLFALPLGPVRRNATQNESLVLEL